jgi:UDP-N-acetylmuramoyl-tripeptide--D-alanyl-D-alanine ligase
VSSLGVPVLIVENTINSLGEFARNHRRKFSLPIIAIGGSNGKTTTKDMIAAVLSRKYRVLKTEGNLNNNIGVPQTLFRLSRKHQIAVIEVGTNHFGEVHYLCDILEPTEGIITNIGKEHLEFFGNEDGALKAEKELSDWLFQNRSSKAKFFLNTSDDALSRSVRAMNGVIKYGFIPKSGDVRGKVISINEFGCALVEIRRKNRKRFRIQLNVPGLHNAENALAAVAVGLNHRVPLKEIRNALEGFAASSKRMQMIKWNGVTILNDTYNSNPDSLIAALGTLTSISNSGKKVVVLADMLELGERSVFEHQRIGELLSEYNVTHLLTFGELARHIYETAEIRDKKHFDDKNEIAGVLKNLLEKNDLVLVKGSRGMKMEEVVEQYIK